MKRRKNPRICLILKCRDSSLRLRSAQNDKVTLRMAVGRTFHQTVDWLKGFEIGSSKINQNLGLIFAHHSSLVTDHWFFYRSSE